MSELTSSPLLTALQLVYIVDEEAARDGARLDAVLGAGARAIWLRAPGLRGSHLFRLARDLRRRTRDQQAALVVGDRADVALAVEAEGVQLGYRSPPVARIRSWFPRWIGASCHSAGELRRATSAGADYAVLSPLFGVPEKGAPLGLPLFERLVADAELPVVGLGGIDGRSVGSVRRAGACGVAVIRALRDADDPGASCRRLAEGAPPA